MGFHLGVPRAKKTKINFGWGKTHPSSWESLSIDNCLMKWFQTTNQVKVYWCLLSTGSQGNAYVPCVFPAPCDCRSFLPHWFALFDTVDNWPTFRSASSHSALDLPNTWLDHRSKECQRWCNWNLTHVLESSPPSSGNFFQYEPLYKSGNVPRAARPKASELAVFCQFQSQVRWILPILPEWYWVTHSESWWIGQCPSQCRAPGPLPRCSWRPWSPEARSSSSQSFAGGVAAVISKVKRKSLGRAQEVVGSWGWNSMKTHAAFREFVPSSQQQNDSPRPILTYQSHQYDTVTRAEDDWVGLAPNHGSYEHICLHEHLLYEHICCWLAHATLGTGSKLEYCWEEGVHLDSF